MGKPIPLVTPHLSEQKYEEDFVKQAFDLNWIAPVGENIDFFEKEIVDYVEGSHAAALSSGSAALHLALKLAGVGKDDVVFCQSLTFVASANPILYQNATPVFIDSDKLTWNMDPKALELAFEKHQAKAVIVVHLYGMSAEMDAIEKICKQNGAILIEDAAESLGTKYKERYTGTIGDFGVYSFNGNKIITTSSGGMLLTKNPEMSAKAKFLASQSREQELFYQHNEIGYNYRMSNVLAGIGRGQLKVLNDRIKKKQGIFSLYKKELEPLEGLEMMPVNDFDESNRWLSCITVKHPTIKVVEIAKVLARNEIETRPIWKPMHLQPLFKKYEFFGTGFSEKLFNQGLCLPSDTKMTVDDQMRVIKTIQQIWRAADEDL